MVDNGTAHNPLTVSTGLDNMPTEAPLQSKARTIITLWSGSCLLPREHDSLATTDRACVAACASPVAMGHDQLSLSRSIVKQKQCPAPETAYRTDLSTERSRWQVRYLLRYLTRGGHNGTKRTRILESPCTGGKLPCCSLAHGALHTQHHTRLASPCLQRCRCLNSCLMAAHGRNQHQTDC